MLIILKFSKSIPGRTKCPGGPCVWDPCIKDWCQWVIEI